MATVHHELGTVNTADLAEDDRALALLPALSEWKPGDAVGTITVPRVVISGALDLFTGGPNAVRVAQALRCELIDAECFARTDDRSARRVRGDPLGARRSTRELGPFARS